MPIICTGKKGTPFGADKLLVNAIPKRTEGIPWQHPVNRQPILPKQWNNGNNGIKKSKKADLFNAYFLR